MYFLQFWTLLAWQPVVIKHQGKAHFYQLMLRWWSLESLIATTYWLNRNRHHVIIDQTPLPCSCDRCNCTHSRILHTFVDIWQRGHHENVNITDNCEEGIKYDAKINDSNILYDGLRRRRSKGKVTRWWPISAPFTAGFGNELKLLAL